MTIDPVSNLIIPKEPQNALRRHMELSRVEWIGRTSLYEKCESLPLVCLKYNMDSLKTHSIDVNYHRLVKNLKFFATKMQCADDNQEDFFWAIMWV